MPDKENDLPNGERSSLSPSAVPKPLRDVKVRHVDEPPPAGKERIHPRRPAPIVPKREETTGQDSKDDKETEQSTE
jgi:hypothetical protein